MIRKLLIANRGEIACRIIRSCQEMGIFTVAVFSDADTKALHVLQADEAVHIGASPATESYLNIEKLIEAAKRSNADAIHPGYGFLAENAVFAQAVIDAGLTWVGPKPDVIAAMGNKREAKNLLKDIPYVPGYTGENQRDEFLIAAANEIGYPIMIKAAAGGGGKGMRRVNSEGGMIDALAAARREAKQAFGDESLMLEKLLIRPRHIEVQIMGDNDGHVIALGERECSIQRRHQKIVEETPAFGLDDTLRAAIHQTAINIGQQLNYSNAGTVEFLLNSDGKFYFMEMNTRLQVEHPVTEMVYAVDLVRWQLEIAQGASLYDLLPPFVEPEYFHSEPDGHAIEVRIYAEDPANNFLPVTGDILHWQAPPHVRTDSGVQSGDNISTYYDPMLAKIIAHGHNRHTAIRKLDRALAQLQFVGMRNNAAFLRRVLIHEEHIAGNISTQFLDDYAELMGVEENIPHIALIAASLAKSNGASRWRNNPNRPIQHHFAVGEQSFELALLAQSNNYQVSIGGMEHHVSLHSIGANLYRLIVDGHQQQVSVFQNGDDWWIHMLKGTYRLQWINPLPLPTVRVAEQGSLRAPMPGQVISIHVKEGQEVAAGDLLLIIEAMKMEHRIEAPYDGTIERIHYNVGEIVQEEAILLALKAQTVI
jgi:geranyl-CoA carboxylase alpha subunit